MILLLALVSASLLATIQTQYTSTIRITVAVPNYGRVQGLLQNVTSILRSDSDSISSLEDGPECVQTPHKSEHTCTSGNSAALAVFLGVPYAQPPLGALRFVAPRPLAPADGDGRRLVRALSFPPACPQRLDTAFDGIRGECTGLSSLCKTCCL